MGPVIAVANQKGGVGKTTLAVNIAACISYRWKDTGRRILLVDTDHQANASYILSRDSGKYEETLAAIYQDEIARDYGDLIQATNVSGVDIVPASPMMASEEMKLASREKKGYRLKYFLEFNASNYDLVIIDCPPAINLFVLNAFYVADQILVPLPPEDLAIQGFQQLMAQVQAVREVNPGLSFLGVVVNMLTDRVRIHREIRCFLEEEFGDKLLGIIHRSVRIQEAEAMNLTLLDYSRTSRSFKEFLGVADNIIEDLGLK